MARLNFKIELDAAGAIGPGKIRLLEALALHGSISAAARAMEMSYRRAWLLIDSLNASFRAPLVASRVGGRAGGSAALTDLGREVVARYRAVEVAAHRAAAADLDALQAAAIPPPPPES